MKTRIAPTVAALLLAAPSFALAVPAPEHASPPGAVPSGKDRPRDSWIELDRLQLTPVVDPVSRDLADARAALGHQDVARSAQRLRDAAAKLRDAGTKALRESRAQAATQDREARDTKARMDVLARRLDVAAARIRAGKIADTAALDTALDRIGDKDLDRRWVVSDVTTWYAVAPEPQRHFEAAASDYARKDFAGAAREVRKAESFLRLESARVTGNTRAALVSADAALERTAHALETGAVHSATELDEAFLQANRALAQSHGARAAASIGHDASVTAGYELKAAADSLEGAAAWTKGAVRSAAAAAATDARALGDRLANGGRWTRREVADGLESMSSALDRLGDSIGLGHGASRS
ncbi:MAG: hypothetical protein GC151_14400 [Betaproteobacteria bacterium]|nr:hypothetical protein [Betaproteobacteria bacterium]